MSTCLSTKDYQAAMARTCRTTAEIEADNKAWRARTCRPAPAPSVRPRRPLSVEDKYLADKLANGWDPRHPPFAHCGRTLLQRQPEGLFRKTR